MSKYKIRKSKKNRNPIPLIEAVPGQGHKEWEIQDAAPGRARCRFDEEKGTLSVPITDDPCEKCGEAHNESTRLHEMLHAAHSPPPEDTRTTFQSGGEKYSVTDEGLFTAEEIRMDWKAVQIARKRRLTYSQGCTTEVARFMLQTARDGDFRELAMQALAASNGLNALNQTVTELTRLRAKAVEESDHITETKYHKTLEVMQQMYNFGVNVKEFAQNNYMENFSSWSRQLHVAKAVDDYLDVFEDAAEQLQQQMSKIKNDMEKEKDDLSDLQKKVQYQREIEEDPEKASKKHFLAHLRSGGSMKQMLDGTKRTFERQEDQENNDEVLWGKITFEEPPRTKKLPAYKRNSKPKASDEGAVPMYMHRWAVDKAIFKATRREDTGSVLIDVSGSMSLTAEQLQEIIEAAPAGIVACYSGEGGREDSYNPLRIIGKDGMWYEGPGHGRPPHSDMPGGNEIDKPALEWLAKQPLPRIWVSDGQVVSPSHSFSAKSWDDCEQVILANRINRVLEPEEARDALLGRKELWR